MPKQLLIGTAFSLVCLFLVMRDLDFTGLWHNLLAGNPIYYPLCILAIAVAFWVRALRWRLLLKPMLRAGVGELYSVILIGSMANNIFPARLGEFVRAYLVGRLKKVPGAGVMATIVVERLLDGIVLLLVLFVSLAFIDSKAHAGPIKAGHLRAAGYTLLAIYSLLIAFLFWLWRWPESALSLLERIVSVFPARFTETIMNLALSFQEGIIGMKQSGAILRIVLLSLLIWTVVLVAFGVLLPAFGLPASILLAALVLAGTSLGVAVPAAPGYIGTMNLAVSWALVLGGADYQKALGYAVVSWAVNYFPITLAGLVELWRKGLSLKNIRNKSRFHPVGAADAPGCAVNGQGEKPQTEQGETGGSFSGER